MAENLTLEARVVDGFSGPLQMLRNQLQQVSRMPAATNMQKDFKKVSDEIAKSAQSIATGLMPQLSKINVASLGVTAALGAIGAGLKGFAASTQDISTFSKEVGLSTERIKAWQRVGEQAGLSADKMRSGISSFADTMLDVKRRWGEAYSGLIDMNLADLAEKLVKAPNLSSAMDALFEGLANIPDAVKRRRVLKMLGLPEDWSQITTEFGQRTKGMVDEAQSHVTRLGDSTVAAAKRFNAAFLEMQNRMDDLKTNAFGPLLEASVKLYDQFKQPAWEGLKRMSEFASELLDRIKDPAWEAFRKLWADMDAFARNLADSFRTVMGFLGKVDEATSSSAMGSLVGGLRGKTDGGGHTADESVSKLNRYLGKPGASVPSVPSVSAKPAEELKKSNEALKDSNEGLKDSQKELKRVTEQQVSLFQRIISAAGLGGDGTGLGTGLAGLGGSSGANLRFGRRGGGMGGGESSGPVDQAKLDLFKKMGGMPSGAQAEEALSAMKPLMDQMAPAGTAPGGAPMTTITTNGGKKFTVASAFAENFKGFLNDYEKAGGQIGPNSGGLAGRAGNASYHPLGRAIDLNQVGRGVRAGGATLPRDVEDRLAAKWGLYPGSRFGDIGHFEVRNSQMARAALEGQGKAVGSGPVAQGSVPPPNPDAPGHLGLKNWNLFNLKANPRTMGKYEGVLGSSEGRDQGDPQLVFKNLDMGIKAGEKLALEKASQGRNTVAKLVAAKGGWTPGNMKSAQAIAKRMGVGVHDPIDMTDPDTRVKYLKSLGQQEQLPGKDLNDALDKIEGVVKRKNDVTGKVEIHLHDGLSTKNARVKDAGIFKDTTVHRSGAGTRATELA